MSGLKMSGLTWLLPVARTAAAVLPALLLCGQAPSPSLPTSSRAASASAGVVPGGGDPALAPLRGPCAEHIPRGHARPPMVDRFPNQVAAGHVAWLEVEITHGAGERVLPSGFGLKLDSPEGHALGGAGFVIPDPQGPARPRMERAPVGAGVETRVTLPFVPLPAAGRGADLVLPAVPIAVSRASGELLTLCTQPHAVHVVDPTANIPNAQPRPNPEALPQREVWTTAKNVVLTALVALPLGVLLALMLGRWLRRPRPEPPPPPPRPPWEVALETLDQLSRGQWVAAGRSAELFAGISLCLRRYLGERYGFDGVESTTGEALARLKLLPQSLVAYDDIAAFLGNADLVKFAKVRPDEASCEAALAQARRVVQRTRPGTDGPSSPLAEPPVEPPRPTPPALGDTRGAS